MLEPWALTYRSTKKRIARKFYQDALLRDARCLIATSAQELANIRKLGFANPIAVIPNGVDLDIPPLPKTSSSLPRTVLFLSRIHPVKGLIHAIEAWHALRPHEWRLKIVGPSEVGHREQLETLVQRYGLSQSVSFHGPVSGYSRYRCYYDADLFLLPSLSENFGLVVAEALACGLPVITTTGTPWSGLQREQCGWFIEPGTEPLTETLRTVFRLAPDELQARGERGRRWVSREFRWDAIADQTIALYEWILGRANRPSFVD